METSLSESFQPSQSSESDDAPINDPITFDRRNFLATIGSFAGITSLAGCSSFERGTDAVTSGMSDERAQELAERFAPTLYFDEHEQWYPTDPRPYATENGDETVVDGFNALDEYTDRFKQSEEPPAPTVFYHGVKYEDASLAVIQFWYYSVFDQFTTNFHWHDWEVLHVFVDTDSGDPQLYVASSHSGHVPNNEFLDPKTDYVPRILSELGSHSSALSVNDVADRFERLPIGGTIADITNSAIESIEDIANIPLAYGLPRDEGFQLPYVVPEIAERPLYDHDRLPSVSREDLIAEELSIRSFADLLSPPDDLPDRATGLIFQYAGREEDADIEYDLIPSIELEHIADFTGPQLSFEFSIPAFAEDAIANHITTTGVPWDQPRYDNPAVDISDFNHRAELANRYNVIGEPASINTVVGKVTEAISFEEAPENEGLTTEDLSLGSIALLESKPEAVPTFNGLVVIRDVPEGEHRLTVNGPGVEPYSETVEIATEGSGPTSAGVNGEVPMVARENAIKLEVGIGETDVELTDLALEDDFAGRLYDAPLDGSDGVYVHRGGAYTTEVRDANGEIGAYRVNPSDEDRVRLEAPQTGKESLSEYLANVAEETASAVAAVGTQEDDPEDTANGSTTGGQTNAVQGLATALEAVAEAARRAADRAANGDQDQADQSLNTVMDRLDRVQSRLVEAAEDIPNNLERAIGHRLEQSRRRSDQALAATKL